MYLQVERVDMAVRPKLRTPTARTLNEIKEEHEYGSIDEAITHVLREADYDV